ncbi:MAG TPA: cell division protein ZapD [Gammaproteobacteria bacterium]|nr:cell division protein ZapD [Gammaproteobacteria bacterium]
MENTIIYEQPLNERMRTFMRLEHLFQQSAYNMRGFSVWDSRATIAGLIDILDLLSRGDLKTEILKELDYQQTALAALKNRPGVDQQQLGSILAQLQQAQEQLHEHSEQLGQSLRENELLNSLRQRSSITCGCCSFDLPAYHFWLQQDPEKRSGILEQWYDSLAVISRPIDLILAILREGADPREVVAEQGFYQQSPDGNAPVQLLRVSLPAESNCFPEISAGKHRFTIRMLEPQPQGRPLQTQEDVPFSLWCCAL